MAAKGNSVVITFLSLCLLLIVSCQTNIDNGEIPEMNEKMKAYFESFIEERLSKLASRCEKSNDNVVLKERMAHLENEMINLKSKYNDLMNEVEMLKANRFSEDIKIESRDAISDLDEVKSGRQETSRMQGSNNITSGTVKDLSHSSSDMNNVSNDNGSRIRRGTPVITDGRSIAFSAVVTDSLSNWHAGQIIHFRRTITNLGLHYNDQTGVFTCPETGTYVFHTSIYVHAQGWVYYNIVKNGNVVSWGLTNSYHDNIVSSKLVVVHLEKNDTVWVKVQEVFNNNAIIYDKLSSFSGFKIQS